jgi:hypothetical protein
MGARPYSPLLGRFLTVDPVEGGSANNYDYTSADPTNGTDLDGSRPHYRYRRIFVHRQRFHWASTFRLRFGRTLRFGRFHRAGNPFICNVLHLCGIAPPPPGQGSSHPAKPWMSPYWEHQMKQCTAWGVGGAIGGGIAGGPAGWGLGLFGGFVSGCVGSILGGLPFFN